MAVDIEIKRTPSYKVAYLVRVGSGSSEPLRREFQELERWAKKSRVKTGKYIFHFFETGRTPDRYRFEACLEIKGNPKPEGEIKIRKLPQLTVARVRFNPEEISPRLVYSGIYGWLSDNDDYRGSGGYSREIYSGNPWTHSQAWADIEVQVPATRKKSKKDSGK